jgi:hypothetical protein
MTKPLAIDLYCGLGSVKTKLFLCADVPVKKFVACRAKYPDHMPLSVGDDLPCAIPLELGLVRDLQNSVLTARLAGARKVWVFSAKPPQHGISERPSRIIDLLNVRLAPMEFAPLFARGFAGAVFRAVAAVGARRCDVEVPAASTAIPPRLRDIGLFAASHATGAASAWRGAIEFVRANGGELFGAFGAKQIVHHGGLA